MKRANRVTRSGPELRRRPSRGTNINPFTPREIQGWSRNGDARGLNQDETWTSTPQSIRDESKPQKVHVVCLPESGVSWDFPSSFAGSTVHHIAEKFSWT